MLHMKIGYTLSETYSKYITHINLDYDKAALREEVEELVFKPFSPPEYYFHETWLKARVKHDVIMFPHIEELHKLFNDSLIVAYRQLAETSVHMHVDPATMCSINIVLTDDYSPVIFEDFGKINYECALFNTSLRHSVPAYHKERLLLKFAFKDKSYDDVLNNPNLSSLFLTSS